MDKAPYFLAFDPGEKATGWSAWAEDASWLDLGIAWGLDELQDLMTKFDKDRTVKVVIIEDYRIRSHQLNAHRNKRVRTIQAKGKIEAIAQLWGAKVVFQEANIKPIAEKWTGNKPKGHHDSSHGIDAYNHGEYYLISHNIKELKL